jgi:hypothetical protein
MKRMLPRIKREIFLRFQELESRLTESSLYGIIISWFFKSKPLMNGFDGEE